ncbi:hypothetical protein TWF481_010914 [Arthrobotrys musiformis]|uniref:Uncharacterized protein n=1 Tax=Arthrobotrys musiformis TaxID=47236 RepID=A0AAV9VWS7_9PEZI
MAGLLRKLSECCSGRRDRDSDSEESEVNDTRILPHRMRNENLKGILKKPTAADTHGIPKSQNDATDRKAEVPRTKSDSDKPKSPQPIGLEALVPDPFKPRKDPFHRDGKNNDSTFIISPGSNFPVSGAAPPAVNDTEDETSLENILPEELLSPIPKTLARTAKIDESKSKASLGNTYPEDLPPPLPQSLASTENFDDCENEASLGNVLPEELLAPHAQTPVSAQPTPNKMDRHFSTVKEEDTQTTRPEDQVIIPYGDATVGLDPADGNADSDDDIDLVIPSRPSHRRCPLGSMNLAGRSSAREGGEGGPLVPQRDTRRDGVIFLTQEQAAIYCPNRDVVTAEDTTVILRYYRAEELLRQSRIKEEEMEQEEDTDESQTEKPDVEERKPKEE